MKIAWISELGYRGKISDNFPNMKATESFIKCLDAECVPFVDVLNDISILKGYDLAIINTSKSQQEIFRYISNIQALGVKVLIMQEASTSYYQNWSTIIQIEYLNALKEADGVLCHNEADKQFFKGITDKFVENYPTPINLDMIKEFIKEPLEKKEICMIFGNMTEWYNGMNSYLVARDFPFTEIWFVSMGRKQNDEEIALSTFATQEIKYIPYTNWLEFAKTISEVKYAIHLFPQYAAGSAMELCAALGIPCIAPPQHDTQNTCFCPSLCCNHQDLIRGKEIMSMLVGDDNFYMAMREQGLRNVQYFDINNIRNIMLKKIRDGLFNGN